MKTGYASHLSDSGVAIFLFHGVIPEQRHSIRNYTRKHLTRERFEAVLDELSREGTPVSMDDVLDWSTSDRPIPPRAFAVTFDDGFENNYTVAAPILERRRLPCAFYITTGFVDANRVSWIDRIEYAFEITPVVELDLPFVLSGRTAGTPEDKTAWLDQIRKIIKQDKTTAPDVWADRICQQLGTPSTEADPWLDRKMSWRQVAELAGQDLFTIGGHGHTHRILAFLDRSALIEEIRVSTQMLNSHLKTGIHHYSYPEGQEACYSEEVIRELKVHGITCCPTAIDGINPPGSDPFHLKRIMVV